MLPNWFEDLVEDNKGFPHVVFRRNPFLLVSSYSWTLPILLLPILDWRRFRVCDLIDFLLSFLSSWQFSDLLIRFRDRGEVKVCFGDFPIISLFPPNPRIYPIDLTAFIGVQPSGMSFAPVTTLEMIKNFYWFIWHNTLPLIRVELCIFAKLFFFNLLNQL